MNLFIRKFEKCIPNSNHPFFIFVKIRCTNLLIHNIIVHNFKIFNFPS